MSTRPPQESTGLLDHLAVRYIRRGLDTSHPTDEPFVMSDEEAFLVQRASVVTLGVTMLIGVFILLVFQLPQLFWPYLFVNTRIYVFDQPVVLPLITGLYALLLLYIALHLTTNVNKLGTRIIAHICQFPRLHDARYEYHAEKMASLTDSKLTSWFMHPRVGLFVYFLLNLFAGFVVSVVSIRLLANYTPTFVAILVGLFVYGVWLCVASNRVLNELRIRIMAPITIRSFVNELREEWHNNDQFQSILVDVLAYAGLPERQHVYAHLLLTETLLDRISVFPIPHESVRFADQMAALPTDMQRSVERLLIFSILIDGHVTTHERRQLRELQQRNLLTHTPDDIERLRRDYRAGKGLWL